MSKKDQLGGIPTTARDREARRRVAAISPKSVLDAVRPPTTCPIFEPLNPDQRYTTLPAVLSTQDAAAFINRRPQTLRKWSCLENGPLRPIRINGRLAWRVSDLSALLRGETAA